MDKPTYIRKPDLQYDLVETADLWGKVEYSRNGTGSVGIQNTKMKSIHKQILKFNIKSKTIKKLKSIFMTLRLGTIPPQWHKMHKPQQK